MKNRPFFAGIGELLWDLFPDHKKPGGAPANVVYHAVQLGAEGYLISRVGDDRAGKELLEFLEKKGIPRDGIQIDHEKSTGTVSVSFEEENEPVYHITEDVAWDKLTFYDRLKGLARQTDAVIFGTLAQRTERSKKTIRQFIHSTRSDTLKVLDLNLRPAGYSAETVIGALEMADILKLNRQEFLELEEILRSRDVISVLLEHFQLRGICLTKGKAGSTWIDRENRYVQKVFAADLSAGDQVGLGDGFTALFTLKLIQGEPPAVALDLASRYATLLAGKRGGMPALSRQELLPFRL